MEKKREAEPQGREDEGRGLRAKRAGEQGDVRWGLHAPVFRDRDGGACECTELEARSLLYGRPRISTHQLKYSFLFISRSGRKKVQSPPKYRAGCSTLTVRKSGGFEKGGKVMTGCPTRSRHPPAPFDVNRGVGNPSDSQVVVENRVTSSERNIFVGEARARLEEARIARERFAFLSRLASNSYPTNSFTPTRTSMSASTMTSASVASQRVTVRGGAQGIALRRAAAAPLRAVRTKAASLSVVAAGAFS